MSKIVRLGDPSDHGGTMVSATGKFKVNGKIVCVSGDMHSCPIKDHGTTPVSSSKTLTSGGKSVIKVGSVAGCGAVISDGGSVETT